MGLMNKLALLGDCFGFDLRRRPRPQISRTEWVIPESETEEFSFTSYIGFGALEKREVELTTYLERRLRRDLSRFINKGKQ